MKRNRAIPIDEESFTDMRQASVSLTFSPHMTSWISVSLVTLLRCSLIRKMSKKGQFQSWEPL